MKSITLELLCCPDCKAPLHLRDERGDGTVEEGILFCSSCRASFLIKNGAAHFISTEELRGRNRQFARFYDWFSRFEALSFKVFSLPMGGERKVRGEVLNRLDRNAERILEVSVGSGGNLRYLFEQPALNHVCGLDISAGQLARCRKLVVRHRWPVDLFLATAEKLPFKSGSFDCVFHIGGINFFSEKKKAIDEMIRVARPGSKIVIADESERVARSVARIAGLLSAHRGEGIDLSVPVHLVPDTMQGIRVDGIWRAHGQYHGYCLEFTKPV
jgi:ubiquinone/menaquinone biosynthesis C-methylase UbiE